VQHASWLKQPGDSQAKRYRTSGLYETAEKLFGKSDDWDRQVTLWLNLSKPTRIFVIPLIVTLAYNGVCNLTNWRALNEFSGVEHPKHLARRVNYVDNIVVPLPVVSN
jgi:hypothetical protein